MKRNQISMKIHIKRILLGILAIVINGYWIIDYNSYLLRKLVEHHTFFTLFNWLHWVSCFMFFPFFFCAGLWILISGIESIEVDLIQIREIDEN